MPYQQGPAASRSVTLAMPGTDSFYSTPFSSETLRDFHSLASPQVFQLLRVIHQSTTS